MVCLRPAEQPVERVGVAAGGGVEGLAAGEGLVAGVGALPGAVDVERLALELADADVVEVGIDDRACRLPVAESEAGGLLRPRELGGGAELDRDARELGSQLLRLAERRAKRGRGRGAGRR